MAAGVATPSERLLLGCYVAVAPNTWPLMYLPHCCRLHPQGCAGLS